MPVSSNSLLLSSALSFASTSEESTTVVVVVVVVGVVKTNVKTTSLLMDLKKEGSKRAGLCTSKIDLLKQIK